jgi:phosphohistidine phosphatase SixA
VSADVPPGFTERFAVRLPDGSIATHCGAEVLWPTRADAERQLDHGRHVAAMLGVHDWGGEVVSQLCSPFVGARDTAAHLVADLQRWLEAQTGGAS